MVFARGFCRDFSVFSTFSGTFLKDAPFKGHPAQIPVYRSVDRCYFLVSEQESNQRSRPGRGITGKSHPRPGPHSRRVSHRPLKMSRFSAGSAVQTYRLVECKRSKIGTFLNAGWRCGGGYLRGRDWPVAPLRSASFGPFLAETRKGHRGLVSKIN